MIDEALFSSARTESGSNNWTTPLHLYEYLNNTYKFTLDAAASDSNHLCEQYFTEEMDALKQTWTGRVFLNCPYSLVKKFMQKAFNSCKDGDAELVVCLVAARTETAFWQDYVDKRALQVFFLRGRLVFGRTQEELEAAATKYFSKRSEYPSAAEFANKVEELKRQPAPFPSAIVVYHRDCFKLGSLGKTQYNCLDLRSIQPKLPRKKKEEQPSADVGNSNESVAEV